MYKKGYVCLYTLGKVGLYIQRITQPKINKLYLNRKLER